MIPHSPPVLGVDISKWQQVVGSNYEYPVFCARVHSGYGIDGNFVANARVINANPGVKVKAAYIVPVKGMDRGKAVRDVMAVLPAGWCVMIDEESGAGFQGSGNHSDVNNDLRERFIAALGGNRRKVWGYANGGDWASGWPDRRDTPMIVAKYSSNDSDLIRSSQCIGWQYSDGQEQWGVPNGYPRGSRAIGNCDMNVFGFASGSDFAAWLGGTGHTTSGGNATPIEEDDMPFTEAQIEKIVHDEVLDVVRSKEFANLLVASALDGCATAIRNAKTSIANAVWGQVMKRDDLGPAGATNFLTAILADTRKIITKVGA